ncbi:DUF386 domain-containing protein [Paenibacillus albicereus]|uniref:DUF386 domain-containing protein n=1 Tax=Paenibacillus albicereus TaxID=2726185 RepID=A0A6H2GYX9_9BACL|nr:YhcH/YjgK/YiaL family protein [Paenibacillus albicereus]QJC52620.1 DUF386 domain-containing protein [Paenibacillus albicereus]
MMAGTLASREHEALPQLPAVAEALSFLRKTDFGAAPDGRIELGEGVHAVVMTLDTRAAPDRLAESHERCLDIHCLLEGEERIGWKRREGGEAVRQPYDAEDDCALYGELDGEAMLALRPGMYVVLDPQDIHRPGVAAGAPGTIRKVVVKIRLQMQG